MPKKNYRTIKKGKGALGLIITIVIASIILVIGSITAISATGIIIGNVEESSGVTAQINIYGNDLVVDIIGGERVSELEYIFLEIGNYELPSTEKGKPVEIGQTKVVFTNIIDKIRGVHLVGIRGYFSDGKTLQILSKEIRFS